MRISGRQMLALALGLVSLVVVLTRNGMLAEDVPDLSKQVVVAADYLATAYLTAAALYAMYRVSLSGSEGRPSVLGAVGFALAGSVVALFMPRVLGSPLGSAPGLVGLVAASPLVLLSLVFAIRLSQGMHEGGASLRADRADASREKLRARRGDRTRYLRERYVAAFLAPAVLLVLVLVQPYGDRSLVVRALVLLPLLGVIQVWRVHAAASSAPEPVTRLLASTYAVDVPRESARQLHAMVERWAARYGVKKPMVCRIPGGTLNAFVAGPAQGRSVLAFGEGMLRTLTADELDAVVAVLVARLADDGVADCADVDVGARVRMEDEVPPSVGGFETVLAADAVALETLQSPDALVSALLKTADGETRLEGVTKDFVGFLWAWPGGWRDSSGPARLGWVVANAGADSSHLERRRPEHVRAQVLTRLSGLDDAWLEAEFKRVHLAAKETVA